MEENEKVVGNEEVFDEEVKESKLKKLTSKLGGITLGQCVKTIGKIALAGAAGAGLYALGKKAGEDSVTYIEDSEVAATEDYSSNDSE